jgi:hypothetical protein
MKHAGKLSESRTLRHLYKKLFLIALCGAFSSALYGQADTLSRVSLSEQSYILRRGDVIDILVMEHPEFSVPNLSLIHISEPTRPY